MKIGQPGERRGPVPLHLLRSYVLEARKETYDGEPSPVLEIPDTYLLKHSRAPFCYRAFLFGERESWRFQKSEVVSLGDRLVWHSFIQGGFLSSRVSYVTRNCASFLEEVLRSRPETRLDRTVKVKKGDWLYYCRATGYIDEFFGCERVRWKNRWVYRTFFSGRLHTRY